MSSRFKDSLTTELRNIANDGEPYSDKTEIISVDDAVRVAVARVEKLYPSTTTKDKVIDVLFKVFSIAVVLGLADALFGLMMTQGWNEYITTGLSLAIVGLTGWIGTGILSTERNY